MDFLSIFAAFTLCLLALLMRLQHGSWFAPGAFVSAVWALLTFLPPVLAPDFYFSPLAILLIFCCVFFTSLGSLVGIAWGRYLLPATGGTSFGLHPFPLIRVLVFMGFLTGLGAVAILLVTTGRGFGTFFSVAELARAGREFSIARYHEGYIPPLACRLLFTWTYFSALMGGVLFARSSRMRERFLALLPLLPAIAYATLLTTRATIMQTMIFWFAGYLPMRICMTRGRLGFFRFAVLSRLAVAGALFFVLFITLQMSRYGWSGFDQAMDVLSRARIWFFGYLSGFSIWVDHRTFPVWDPGYGLYTFGGLFDFLGFAERLQGIYEDFVVIGEIGSTNVFTIFRGLFLDYGIVGSLFLLFITGVAAGFAYNRLENGKTGLLPVLSLFYLMVMWSHVVSSFNYNTLLLAWLMAVGYFSLNSLSRRIGRSPSSETASAGECLGGYYG
jgi:oligosaccharide repeat unit polymerase